MMDFGCHQFRMINLDNLDLSTHPREKIMAGSFSFLVRRAQAQFGNVEPDPRHPLEPSRHFSDTIKFNLISANLKYYERLKDGRNHG